MLSFQMISCGFCLDDKSIIKLPTKTESLQQGSDLWLPKSEALKNYLKENHILGYNLINLKKSLKILNYCATAYIIKSSQLFLKKLDLVIIISPRIL